MLVVDHDALNAHQGAHHRGLHFGKQLVRRLDAMLAVHKHAQIAQQPFTPLVAVIFRRSLLNRHVGRMNICQLNHYNERAQMLEMSSLASEN